MSKVFNLIALAFMAVFGNLAKTVTHYGAVVVTVLSNFAADVIVGYEVMARRLAARAPPLHSEQRGEINIGGLMMMGIAMIFLAVGFIIYPIIMDATDEIMAWTAAETLVNLPGYVAGPPVEAATVDIFTGLVAVVGIVPLLVLLGFVTAGAISGFMGIKMMKSASGSLNPGSLMMLGIGLIFIAVALIIYPVVLDGVAVAMDSAIAAGNYTGLVPILGVTPLIVLVAFVTGGIVAGFFGIKGMRASAAG